MLFAWIGDHLVSLLWMVTVLLSAGIVAGIVASAFDTLAQARSQLLTGIHATLGPALAEALQGAVRAQQASWKEWHRHENPACVVCKEEAELQQQGGDSIMHIRLQ